ncbi:COX15/CtaA family protein [Pontibacter harenae]|uniref:COX15/CtaA family protein n=1 Tax=Pontibacter harenae TaxID=2894083 RepID=UPI001E31015E|nr:COX15/CtaA family protein [Pontibacter harenae]MCC9165480.1 COX15/CtaA family protein [Pontibacter harenae]
MQHKNLDKPIVLWLLSSVLLILAMVVIGGITRLTGSGLSIVEWNVISGTLPPLSEAEWLITFQKYQQFPEYQKLNTTMTLSGFKQIFWWEYLHRLLGRAIGVVFILPFLYFLAKRRIAPWLFKRLLFILLLGATQGLMGWLMVKSGLVDMPHVSHYRLAAHLCLALALISTILWTVADVVQLRPKQNGSTPKLQMLSKLVLALLLLQIILGAFVAGLKAGFYYNTYPLMNGEIFPSQLWPYLSWTSLWSHGTVVQFLHRWIAIVAFAAIVHLWRVSRRGNLNYYSQNLITLLLLTTLLQVALGITTLMLAVPLALGVLHQVVAFVLFSVAVLATHSLRNKNVQKTPDPLSAFHNQQERQVAIR